MVIEILMPALSPTMTVGTLRKWCKAIGDKVRAGETLMEIETDKSTMEYECVDDGILAKIFVEQGTEGVKVNELICIFAVGDETVESLKDYQPKTVKPEGETKPPIAENGRGSVTSPAVLPDKNTGVTTPATIERLKASPIARQIANENNIDLTKISGSGPDGRIIKSDVLAEIARRNSAGIGGNVTDGGKNDSSKQSNNEKKTTFGRAENTKIQISGIRKVIADRLLHSKTTIPHFYLNTQCIIDDLLAMRKKINEKLGLKITINDLIVKAVSSALTRFPEMNRCWGGDHIVQCGNVDVAVAVDIPDGLITPVVEDANKLSITELSEKLKDLISRARDNKLKPSEYQGGSLTISNLGMFGIKGFFAIVNPPHASILSIGGVFRQPIVEENDTIKIKSVMELGISADHRVVDGALAAKFLSEIRKLLEEPVLFLA